MRVGHWTSIPIVIRNSPVYWVTHAGVHALCHEGALGSMDPAPARCHEKEAPEHQAVGHHVDQGGHPHAAAERVIQRWPEACEKGFSAG
jgi:hypothetical protein